MKEAQPQVNQPDSIVQKQEVPEEISLQQSLRPQSLQDYIGQDQIKENLSISIEAAKKRNEPLDHVLLYGSPGLGKTTLAHIIANEMKSNVLVTSGPALERAGDLAAILTNLQPGDVLFIDEIHRLNRAVEEILYPAMEDFALDLVIGKGPSARTLRIDLPKFTIVGATTRLSLLSSPLRDRFGNVLHLSFYSDDQISAIIQRSSQILGMNLDAESALSIATRSRKTPRIANRLLKRVRDYSDVKHEGSISPEIASSALDLLQVDVLGLDQVDRLILQTIIDKFAGGPVGLNTIAAATDQEIGTVEDVCEPFLLQIGMIERTPRGRQATDLAYKHLGLSK